MRLSYISTVCFPASASFLASLQSSLSKHMGLAWSQCLQLYLSWFSASRACLSSTARDPPHWTRHPPCPHHLHPLSHGQAETEQLANGPMPGLPPVINRNTPLSAQLSAFFPPSLSRLCNTRPVPTSVDSGEGKALAKFSYFHFFSFLEWKESCLCEIQFKQGNNAERLRSHEDD